MPNAYPLSQALEHLEPDVPPVAPARLQDGEAQAYVSSAEAAQPRDVKGDDAGQRAELVPMEPLGRKAPGLPVPAAGAGPRRGWLGRSLPPPSDSAIPGRCAKGTGE